MLLSEPARCCLKGALLSASSVSLKGALAAVCLILCFGCAGPGEAELPSGPARVLILGDSISIGYTQRVRRALGDEAVVVRPMREDGAKAENCAGTSYGKDHIQRWLDLEGGPFDVVHFNFGLHDLKRVNPDTRANSNDPEAPNQAPLEVYAGQLRGITCELLESDATVIFATTTPVPEGGVRPHRDPGDVLRYNAAAVALMSELGVEVNDLYAFILPQLGELQRPVNVHFTPDGSEALAGEVAAAIRTAFPRFAAPKR